MNVTPAVNGLMGKNAMNIFEKPRLKACIKGGEQSQSKLIKERHCGIITNLIGHIPSVTKRPFGDGLQDSEYNHAQGWVTRFYKNQT